MAETASMYDGMKITTSPSSSPSGAVDLRAMLALAQLLERLEHSPRVAAEPYRQVALKLTELFADASAGADGPPALQAVLEAFPSAAQVYENLHYPHAGLCRSPLEASLDAEQGARQVIERVRLDSKHNSAYGKS